MGKRAASVYLTRDNVDFVDQSIKSADEPKLPNAPIENIKPPHRVVRLKRTLPTEPESKESKVEIKKDNFDSKETVESLNDQESKVLISKADNPKIEESNIEKFTAEDKRKESEEEGYALDKEELEKSEIPEEKNLAEEIRAKHEENKNDESTENVEGSSKLRESHSSAANMFTAALQSIDNNIKQPPESIQEFNTPEFDVFSGSAEKKSPLPQHPRVFPGEEDDEEIYCDPKVNLWKFCKASSSEPVKGKSDPKSLFDDKKDKEDDRRAPKFLLNDEEKSEVKNTEENKDNVASCSEKNHENSNGKQSEQVLPMKFRKVGDGLLRILKLKNGNVRLVIRQKGTWTLLLNSPLSVIQKYELSGSNSLKFIALDNKLESNMAVYCIKFDSDLRREAFFE